MIKIPSYLDVFTKTVSILGVDFDSEERKTQKSHIKELMDFNKQADDYEKTSNEVLNLLAGTDQKKSLLIRNFMGVIESMSRYLGDKNYETLAGQMRAMWGVAVFYYVPQLACMMSMYNNEFGIPAHLLKSEFMLPFRRSNKVIAPILRLREYLEEAIRLKIDYETDNHVDFLQSYFSEWKNGATPNNQTKSRILNALDRHYPGIDNRQNIGSTISVAVIVSRIYRQLCKTFKDEDYALMLVDYFKDCFNTCEQLYNQNLTDVRQPSDLESMVALHLSLLRSELLCTKLIPISSEKVESFIKAPSFRKNRRMEVFTAFNAFLGDTKRSDVNKLDIIDTHNFSNGILSYNPEIH